LLVNIIFAALHAFNINHIFYWTQNSHFEGAFSMRPVGTFCDGI